MQEWQQIFLAFKNTIFKNEEVEKKAEEKLKHCFDCPIRNEGFCSKYKEGIVNKDFKYKWEERKKGQVVKGCGCDIYLKVRSNSQCPVGNF